MTYEEALSFSLGNDVLLEGNLTIPPRAKGLVVFAHGSGSSRFSPRNRFVAEMLHKKQLATLLIDLLTKEESIVDESTGEFRFNIDLLASRLVDLTAQLLKNPGTQKLPIGYFGASTGAAAALIAASRGENIFAVVSRGGRPDLAFSYLSKVKAPTLLIVGGHDLEVLALNKHAYEYLSCVKKIEVVPGATHLFEEKGALEQVALLAANWFSSQIDLLAM